MNTDMITAPSTSMAPVAAGSAARTTDSVVAAQIRATVEARYALAVHRPRNWDDVRVRLLAACRRPGFASNKSTLYRKPIGAGVEGLGIRFVEEALRCMGNVLPETTVVYDDPEKRIVSVSVTDLEANLTYRADVTLQKTVERSRPDGNGAYLSVRVNSRGENVYAVLATDDEFQNKEAAAISKAIRSLGLRIIPGDLQDEAEEAIRQIRRDKAAQDPDAERKRIADAFAALHVTPSDLESYLGHPLARCSPTELTDLRGLYGAIRDGETTWASAVTNRDEEEGRQESGSATSTLLKIEAATSLDDLEKIVPELKRLKSGEKAAAREKFRAKKEALSAPATITAPTPAETPVPETGEAENEIGDGSLALQALIDFCQETGLKPDGVLTWCIKHQYLEEDQTLANLTQRQATVLMDRIPELALQKLLKKIESADEKEIVNMSNSPAPIWLYGETLKRFQSALAERSITRQQPPLATAPFDPDLQTERPDRR